ncbi:Cation efflux system protein CzcC [Achromobacter spanius]|nr:Cobalt-zinc-cadmium resistance protein CzcC [Achromobacter spanius]CAB3943335.1 Cobalt-zinc-cadmium resistance protein CzcC [Achromobacter piechaudii]SPT41719.1 Cation efflux system protein CzcC [Achromobacter denitrificans]VEE56433.1 Cation efflux system protein CzcC [Achromobacter spanius]
MRFKPIPLLVMAATLCGQPVWAQTTPEEAITEAAPYSSGAILTLSEAMDAAFKLNPQVSAAKNNFAASKGLVDQAGRLPNPSLDVSVDDHQRATRTTTTMLSMPIELGGKRSARTQAAQLSSELAGREYEVVTAEIKTLVVSRFFSVAIAQETLRVNRDMADIAEGALRVAQKRVDAGKAPPLERNRAEIELTKAQIDVRQAENDLRVARRELSLLWGDPVPKFELVQAKIDDLPARRTLDDLRAALLNSPRLAAGRLAMEVSKAELNVEKSKRYPDITLSGGVARDNEVGRNKAQFGVSLPLPIFDRNQGNVYAATMQTYKAQDIYREMEARLSADLLIAASTYDLALASAKDYRESVIPTSQKAYEGARKGFEAGKVGYLEVLDAQRTLSQGNISYLTTLLRAASARAEIDRILGQ